MLLATLSGAGCLLQFCLPDRLGGRRPWLPWPFLMFAPRCSRLVMAPALVALRLGSSVTLRTQMVDRFGRTVAEVISGININLALVEDGMA